MANGSIVQVSSNGKQTNAYFTIAKPGSGPGVIVLQEWWGLVDHIKGICDRLAEAGFCALAPDLYHGDQASGPDEAGRMMMALNIDRAGRDLSASIQWLEEQPSVESKKKFGAIGFCMGGQLALYAASIDNKISAVADFYGIHPNVHPDFSKMKASVLGIFAEKDEFVSPDKVKELDEKLLAANIEHHFKIFDGVDHAFFNDSRPEVYNQTAAQAAWKMTVEYFSRELRE